MNRNCLHKGCVFRLLAATLLGLCLGWTGLRAQSLQVDPSLSARKLVEDVLLGQGITVLGVRVAGDSLSRGYFTATGLGLDKGVLLSTGLAPQADTANRATNDLSTAMLPGGVTNSDQDLAPLATDRIREITLLEFDFIPTTDTVSFRYLFASDEYPEYADPCGNPYNDVFGFFLSGPGITGKQNLAVLPGNQPVSVRSINSVNNAALYRNNCAPGANCQNHSGTCLNVPNSQMAFDGYTTPLSVFAIVQPCDTYTIKLVIGDVRDRLIDSAVLLEARSFVSKGLQFNLAGVADTNGQGLHYEGCSNTALFVNRTVNLGQRLSLPITYGGTATPGVDYSALADTVFLGPGQSSASVTFQVLADLLPESVEYAVVELPGLNTCGGRFKLRDTLYIQDLPRFSFELKDDTLLCAGASVNLDITAQQAVEPVSYIWNNGAHFGPTLNWTPPPFTDTLLTVLVRDACNGVTLRDTMRVRTGASPTAPLNLPFALGPDTVCFNTPVLLEPRPEGGSGYYLYTWNDGDTSRLRNLTVTQDTTVQVRVFDGCSSQVFTHYIQVSEELLAQVDTAPVVCQGDSLSLQVQAQGGVPPYTYTWQGLGCSGPNCTFLPSLNQSVAVRVQDSCPGPGLLLRSPVEVAPPLQAELLADRDSACVGQPLTLSLVTRQGVPPTLAWRWDDTAQAPQVRTVLGAESNVYRVAVWDSCTDTARLSLRLPPQQPPAVDLEADSSLCSGQELTPRLAGAPTPDASYTWLAPGAQPQQLAGTGPYTFRYDTAGLYPLVLQAVRYNCPATDTQWVRVAQTPHTPPYIRVCWLEGAAAQLPTPAPAGGVWQGYAGLELSAQGIVQQAPALQGVYPVSYSLAGCTVYTQTEVVQFEGARPQALCQSDSLRRLPELRPAGGTWLGPALVDAQTGLVAPAQLPEGETVFRYRYSGCEQPLAVQVTGRPPASFSTHPNRVWLPRAQVRLKPDFGASVADWRWLPGTGDTLTERQPQVEYSQPGEFRPRLLVVDTQGCRGVYESPVPVEVLYDARFTLPTAFSPNADRSNDSWVVWGVNIREAQVWVFDRWGRKVFSSNSLPFVWDGRDPKGELLPEGVYTYRIQGVNSLGQAVSEGGTITLIR